MFIIFNENNSISSKHFGFEYEKSCINQPISIIISETHESSDAGFGSEERLSNIKNL